MSKPNSKLFEETEWSGWESPTQHYEAFYSIEDDLQRRDINYINSPDLGNLLVKSDDDEAFGKQDSQLMSGKGKKSFKKGSFVIKSQPQQISRPNTNQTQNHQKLAKFKTLKLKQLADIQVFMNEVHSPARVKISKMKPKLTKLTPKNDATPKANTKNSKRNLSDTRKISRQKFYKTFGYQEQLNPLKNLNEKKIDKGEKIEQHETLSAAQQKSTFQQDKRTATVPSEMNSGNQKQKIQIMDLMKQSKGIKVRKDPQENSYYQSQMNKGKNNTFHSTSISLRILNSQNKPYFVQSVSKLFRKNGIKNDYKGKVDTNTEHVKNGFNQDKEDSSNLPKLSVPELENYQKKLTQKDQNNARQDKFKHFLKKNKLFEGLSPITISVKKAELGSGSRVGQASNRGYNSAYKNERPNMRVTNFENFVSKNNQFKKEKISKRVFNYTTYNNKTKINYPGHKKSLKQFKNLNLNQNLNKSQNPNLNLNLTNTLKDSQNLESSQSGFFKSGSFQPKPRNLKALKRGQSMTFVVKSAPRNFQSRKLRNKMASISKIDTIFTKSIKDKETRKSLRIQSYQPSAEKYKKQFSGGRRVQGHYFDLKE